MIRPLLLMLALAVVACGSSTAAEDSARRDSLVQAVSSAASCEVIDVHAVLGGDWDRAVFLGPYATNQGAKEALGFDFDVEKVSPWASTEGGMVVVLAKGQQAIAWFGLPSTEVGLAGLDYASLEAAQLTFAVAVDGSGARRLVPQGTAGC